MCCFLGVTISGADEGDDFNAILKKSTAIGEKKSFPSVDLTLALTCHLNLPSSKIFKSFTTYWFVFISSEIISLSPLSAF